MTLQVKDRVLETTTTTGTGDIALGGAYTGFRTFASVCSVNDTCYYLIEGVDGNGYPSGDWEAGLGTYSGTNNLTRTTVLASSNAGSLVNLAIGAKRVGISPIAANIYLPTNLITLVRLHATVSIANNTFAAQSWVASDIVQDVLGAWASGSPTRFTTPAGYTKARFTMQATWTSNSVGNRWAYAQANGSGSNLVMENVVPGVNEGACAAQSVWITGLSPSSDYFEFFFAQNSGGALNLTGGASSLVIASHAMIEWAL